MVELPLPPATKLGRDEGLDEIVKSPLTMTVIVVDRVGELPVAETTIVYDPDGVVCLVCMLRTAVPVEPGVSETDVGLKVIVRSVAEEGTELDNATLLVRP